MYKSFIQKLSRRAFLGSTASFLAVRELPAGIGIAKGRLGMCSFSCHRQWEAVREKSASTKFTDAATFYQYARSIGADGVQTSIGSLSVAEAVQLRKRVEATDGYLEGDVRIPREAKDLDKFENEIKLTKLAGATVARSLLSGSRRYETWKTREAFLAFVRESELRLAMIEPILEKHELKLAVENHKDFTADEMLELLKQFDSPWLGINIDTGNNIALLEDPYEAIEKLAPFAMSVHLKDMALQKSEPPSFLLSEVPCGEGFLDLQRICQTLVSHHPGLVFNLEMATRDPLNVPFQSETYWRSFGVPPDQAKITAVEALIEANPPKQPPPTIKNKSMVDQIIEEEANNRRSLAWMHTELG